MTAVFNVWRYFVKILCAKLQGSKIEQRGFQPSLALTLTLMTFVNFLGGKSGFTHQTLKELLVYKLLIGLAPDYLCSKFVDRVSV